MLDSSYYSESFKTATTVTNANTYLGASILLMADKKGAYFFGFHYGMGTKTSNDGTTTTTFAHSDMGPCLAFYLNKSRSLGFFAGYYHQSKATYTATGASASEWTGTSMQVGFGFDYEAWEGIWLGGKLMMNTLSYNRDVTLGAASSNISYSRTWLSPMISITMR